MLYNGYRVAALEQLTMRILLPFYHWARSIWLMLRLLFDSRVPNRIKLIPVLAILYVASPIDLFPDFIPVLGRLDDLTVVIVALYLFIILGSRYLNQSNLKANRRGSEAEGKVVEAKYRFVDDEEQ